MKSIKEWLEELPEPYRSQALDNASEDMLPIKRAGLSQAIHGAFVWAESPQKRKYWLELWELLVAKEKLDSKEALESIMDIGIGAKDKIDASENPVNQVTMEVFPSSYLEINLKLSNKELAEKIWGEIKWQDKSSDSEIFETIEQILNQHR